MHPVRLLPLSFIVGIVLGAGVLMLPISRTDGSDEVVMPALFASTSAVTVTGLSTVDVSTYWSPFGQGVLLILVQIGGFGIMTLATVLGLLVGGRLGLRTRLMAQAEMHMVNLGEVWPLLRRVGITMFAFESAIALVLTIRYRVAYYDGWGDAVWHGVFHSVMAFNNAGFTLYSDSLVRFLGDAWLIFPLSIGVFWGAVGFPVMAELFKNWRKPTKWTIHTRLTVWGSVALFTGGTLLFLVLEWSNPGTLGPHGVWDKVVTAVEGGIMPRSGGFNSIDYDLARPETLGITDIMMFIGGGSASTAGGIKVTTFLLLAYVILAELRGDPDVTIGRRRIGSQTLRQAVAIALLSVMLVTTTTLFVLVMSDFGLEAVLFECTSAFGTVGLSLGITGDLPYAAQFGLMVLMFVGRVGTITAASALTLRQRTPRYRLPEERPIIG